MSFRIDAYAMIKYDSWISVVHSNKGCFLIHIHYACLQLSSTGVFIVGTRLLKQAYLECTWSSWHRERDSTHTQTFFLFKISLLRYNFHTINVPILNVQFSQFSWVAQSCPTLWTPWTAAHQASMSITNSWSLNKLISIQSMMPSKHLICYCPHLLLPSVFPSIGVFSNESARHIRWPKY